MGRGSHNPHQPSKGFFSFPPQPTEFGGILYKSRLEARFAEFLVENQAEGCFGFEYQPERFGAEGYLPDFVIYPGGVDTRYNVLIEIKPIVFAKEAGLAIRAAQEVQRCLLVIDSLGRGIWGIFARVSRNGELDHYTELQQEMLKMDLNPWFISLANKAVGPPEPSTSYADQLDQIAWMIKQVKDDVRGYYRSEISCVVDDLKLELDRLEALCDNEDEQ